MFRRTFCFAILLTSSVAHAQVYDAATDFSSVNNPTGAWSYGWDASPTLGSGFNLYNRRAQYTSGATIDVWDSSQFQRIGGGVPGVSKNQTNNNSTYLRPGQLGFHPGLFNPDLVSVIRWTAPTTGQYALTSSFVLNDSGDVSVYVFSNAQSLFSGNVTGLGATLSYAPNSGLSLQKGDTLNFIVRARNNGGGDTTGISARITAVPAPSALAVLLIGAVPGAAVLLRRRRKA